MVTRGRRCLRLWGLIESLIVNWRNFQGFNDTEPSYMRNARAALDAGLLETYAFITEAKLLNWIGLTLSPVDKLSHYFIWQGLL